MDAAFDADRIAEPKRPMSTSYDPSERPPRTSRPELTGRFTLPTLRAAWWTWRALRRARRRLPVDGTATTVLPPPTLPSAARRGVYAVLHRQPATCLERALVMQRWLAAHGEPHDVIVGVTKSGGDFSAHAWLDTEAGEAEGEGFDELLRLPAT